MKPGGEEVPSFCLKLFCFDSSAFLNTVTLLALVLLCVNYNARNPCSFRVTFTQNIQQEVIPSNDLINIYYKLPYPTIIIFIKRAKLGRAVFGGKKMTKFSA